MDRPSTAGWADYLVGFLLLLVLSLTFGRIIYRESLVKDKQEKIIIEVKDGQL